MKLLRKAVAAGVLLLIFTAVPLLTEARVLMTGTITGFGMDVTPSATFTMDDWLNRPNLFSIQITNSGAKAVKFARIQIYIAHGTYGKVLSGTLTVVNENRPDAALIRGTQMDPGTLYTIDNTMIDEDSPAMSGGDWSEEFKDEVLRIGALPEGRYTMGFTLEGYYESTEDPIESGNVIDKVMEIRNPTPPELITPDDMSDDTVAVPRFAWQRPLVSDFSNISADRVVNIFYTIKVWRMFGEDGSAISEEDAINRVPIWEVNNLTMESIDFDPGTAWEELIPGRKYCWQVQALDGTGYPISPTNEGKSDVWQFTCQFSPPIINEPFAFYPFSFSWSPARAGGGLIYYRIRIADNADFAGAFEEQDIVMTNFRYPQDASPLRLGITYYLELQSTDDSGIPVGEPATSTFTIPVTEVTLSGPADGATASSNAPTFTWQGNNRYYVVTIFNQESGWSYLSGAIEDTRWTYDGEDLTPGQTYSWNVSPANEMGDPIGDSSDTRTIILPAAGQVSLSSPIDTQVESLTPTFTWQAFSPPSGSGTVEYTIIIGDQSGSTIHSETVTATSFQYPEDAPPLEYSKNYQWSVNAEQNGGEIGTRSQSATFTTPFAAEGSTAASMEEISNMVKTVLGSYPEFADFENLILVSITDGGSSLTPSAFMELFDTFKIVSVTSE